MDSSDDKNQGELSLLEMMKCIESPANTNGDVTVPSALNVIELNEEKGRRQGCEKLIAELQGQLTTLREYLGVSEVTVRRKDALLFQAHQEWRKSETNWKLKFNNAENIIERLESAIANLETQFKSAVEEKQITVLELKNLNLKTDESTCALNNEITKLKDLNGQYLSQLNEVNIRCDEYEKSIQRYQSKLENVKQEYNRMTAETEDLKHNKKNSDAELKLMHERYESSCQQWELHCHNRVQEAIQATDQAGDRRLEIWKKEVETKLRHLVSSLEQQLGVLKNKNTEEINLMTARHQSEVNELRDHSSSLQNKLHKQQREYERLTQNMKQLAEAQWQTVNGIRPSKQTKQGSSYKTKCLEVKCHSDEGSEVSTISSTRFSSTTTNQEEIHQYVNQVIGRHTGMERKKQ